MIGLRIGFTIRFHPPRCLQELRHSDSGGTASVQDCPPALLCFYKGLRQLVATLRWEHDRIIAANSNWNTSGTVERSERNFEVGAKAIEHLRPWVEDETALTEESAKAYCSVLLDTLATLHPKFTE